MIRRNRRPDWRRIKALRSYTFEEAAAALGVHRNTINHWVRKDGLRVLRDRRPYLILGGDLVAFLKSRRAARLRKCQPGEFFCLKCREPRAPAEEMVDHQPITAERGVLTGICPVCGRLMRRFVSRARLPGVARLFGLQLPEAQESLSDTAKPSLSCEMN